MMSFKQHIQESFPPLHENAILMALSDFIDVFQVLDAQKTDGELIVEIREDCPEPGTYAIRLMMREQADETED